MKGQPLAIALRSDMLLEEGFLGVSKPGSVPASEASGPASPRACLPRRDVQVQQVGSQAGRVWDQPMRPFQRRPVTRALGEGRRSLQVGAGDPSNLEMQSAHEPPH